MQKPDGTAGCYPALRMIEKYVLDADRGRSRFSEKFMRQQEEYLRP
jgi:hypothetical protein